MTDPMDTNDDKSQYEAEDFRNKRCHCCSVLAKAGMVLNARHAQFEDEQGESDCKNPVAERFKSIFRHSKYCTARLLIGNGLKPLPAINDSEDAMSFLK